MAEHEAKDKEEQEEARHRKKVQPVYDQLEQTAEPEDNQMKQALAGMSAAEQTSLVNNFQGSQKAEVMLELQRTHGNRYVQRLAESSKEATLDEDLIRRIEVQRGSGKPLEPEVRSQMEAAFGNDFDSVHIHTDTSANRLAKELGAKAFTTGRDILFDEGEYNPQSQPGKALLSHELTHVVQQRKIKSSDFHTPALKALSQPSDRAEREATRVANQVVSQQESPVQVTAPLAANTIARDGRRATVELGPEEEVEMSKGRELGVFGGDSVGHASGWALAMSPDLILWQQGQYESRSDIPHDAVRCGAAAILGAAIVGGPAGLTRFIDRLKSIVDSSSARHSSLLPLETQRSKMRDIHFNWHFNPGPGWNGIIPDIVDAHPFTFDQLSWLQAIAYVQYMGQAGGGMSASDVQAAVSGLAQVRAASPVSPGHYRTISSASQLRGAIAHNNREVNNRFIKPGAPARLQPGQSVILKIATFSRTNHNWVLNAHGVTLSNINGKFQVYNPDTTPLQSFILPYLPKIYRHLPTDNLFGRHLAGAEAAVQEGIFGLTVGLVIQELTAPFRF